MTLRSQAIRLLGVDGRFEENGHVVVDGDDVPELVMLNGDPFIAVEPVIVKPERTTPIEYRAVRPFRFVRKVLP